MPLTDESTVAEVESAYRIPVRPVAELSQAEQLALLPKPEADRIIRGYSEGQLRALAYDWSFWRRPSQIAPGGDDWLTWFIRAGRGFGKTRVGAEQVRQWVNDGYRRPAIVGPTAGDVRDVMVEGESGILSVFPRGQRPHYEPSKRRITFHTGAVATTFSADQPDRLRGPQHDCGWLDEPASWTKGEEAFDNYSFGLRLGQLPRTVVTGTPKPTQWLRDLADRSTTITSVGSTYENVANLAPTFIAEILERYEGTTIGLQEIHAQWLELVEGALWIEWIIEAGRVHEFNRDRTDRVIVAVDPPGETAECGIVVVGGPKRPKPGSHAYVLEDASLRGRPEAWGQQVVATAAKWNADYVLIESNQGGDMVRSTVHNVDASVRVEKLRASKSKRSRAEPVSALYERCRVHHVGRFPKLEGQMTTWVPDESKSPDRLDAMVHGVNDILPPPSRARARAKAATGTIG